MFDVLGSTFMLLENEGNASLLKNSRKADDVVHLLTLSVFCKGRMRGTQGADLAIVPYSDARTLAEFSSIVGKQLK